jgi:hypothetical protein
VGNCQNKTINLLRTVLQKYLLVVSDFGLARNCYSPLGSVLLYEIKACVLFEAIIFQLNNGWSIKEKNLSINVSCGVRDKIKE